MNSQEETITVSIVDDDAAFAQCVRMLVDGNPGMSCLSYYQNGSDAIAKLPEDRPDVVLVDLQMPGISGIECIQQVRSALPQTLFLALTSHSDDEHIFEALKAGATGYLLKRSAPAEILQAILEVRAGGSPMSTYIARRVVQSFSPQHSVKTLPDNETQLSAREEEILKQLTQGYLYKEIAVHLDISLDTVRTYIRRIYQKLQVHSRTEAVVKRLRG